MIVLRVFFCFPGPFSVFPKHNYTRMVALNTGNNDESMRQLDELEEHLHSEDEEGNNFRFE